MSWRWNEVDAWLGCSCKSMPSSPPDDFIAQQNLGVTLLPDGLRKSILLKDEAAELEHRLIDIQ